MKSRLSHPALTLSALAVALLALCAGIASHPLASLAWLPDDNTAPSKRLPRQVAPSLPDLDELKAAWNAPAFSPERSPDPPLLSSRDAAMSSYTLTGLVEGAGARAALIRGPEDRSIQLHVGDTLANGWTLSALGGNKARFSSADRAVELTVDRPRLPDASPLHARLPGSAVHIESSTP